jgi:hypothetical protein
MTQRAIWVYLLLSIVLASFVPFASAQEATACSRLGTSEATEVYFYNDLGFDVTFHWVDFECNEAQDGSSLLQDQVTTASTYDGHEFIIRNSAGEMVGYYIASVADAGKQVPFSNYLGLTPNWWGQEDSIIESEPEIIGEEAPIIKTITTLVPIDESILPTASCSADETIEVNDFYLYNNTGTDKEIYLYWLNTECQEEELYLYPDDYHYRFDVAYAGDDLVFRNADGQLLGYYQITPDDSEKWVELTDIITVEVTVVEREIADFSAGVDQIVNPRRQELQLEPISAHSTLQTVAQELAEGFNPANFSLIEDVNGVSTFDLSENGYSVGIADSWGLEGNIDSLAIYKEGGLTDDDILAVLDIVLDYKGWTNGEIESFGIYQTDNVFVLITSNLIEEEWATFEYEGDAPINDIESGVPTQFSRENGVPTYVFDAQAGLTYALLYQSDDYDTYLYLDDANGVTITSNDDGAGNLNSLIVFKPEVNGRYTARLDSFDTGASGDFTFSIASPDSVVNSHVSPQTPATLAFEVVEGTSYIISAESNEIDTILRVLNENGVELAVNDDYNASTNSFLFWTAPSTGTYQISVDSYNSQQTGPVTIYTGSFK